MDFKPTSLSGMLKHSSTATSNQMSLDVLAEEPVSLTVFVQDRKFLHNPPLSPVQYNAVRAIERIYFPDMYPQLAKEFGPKKNQTVIGPAGAYSEEVVDSYWAAKIPMINKATLQWG